MIIGDPYKFGLSFNFSDWSTDELINGNVEAIMFFTVLSLALAFVIVGVIRFLRKGSSALTDK